MTVGVLLLGLASRRFFGDIPFIKIYVGDIAWALMVYFGMAFTFTKWSVGAIALATLTFAFGIEASQLYHTLMLDGLRATRLGGLVLGFSFLWSDLLCYSAGVLAGLVAEWFIIPVRYQVRRAEYGQK